MQGWCGWALLHNVCGGHICCGKRGSKYHHQFLFGGSVLGDLRGNVTALNSLLVWKQKKEENKRQRDEK